MLMRMRVPCEALGAWTASERQLGVVSAFCVHEPPPPADGSAMRSPLRLGPLWESRGGAGVTSLGFEAGSRRLFVGTATGALRSVA
jgi:hypothetical protein